LPLPKYWATLEDFATLFQYFWHRDFPLDVKYAPGARRVDWTIHIGLVVRNIADLMGLVARFEMGDRRDAVLRSFDGDEIAVEWEWEPTVEGELHKLKEHFVWTNNINKTKKDNLRFAVLVMYAEDNKQKEVIDHIVSFWNDAKWPLLLILIGSQTSNKLRSGREFTSLRMFNLENDNVSKGPFREVPAIPQNVERTRWCLPESIY
jgi:hypothetical protein